MGTISKTKAIQILHQKRINLFNVSDAKKIFGIKKENTLYKFLQRLEKEKVIERIAKGKYHFLFREINDFELANFLINPSYISLESALSFYGILSQFPYTITSLTPLKSRKIILKGKEYEFLHLDKKYFFGFQKLNHFLIALPEKALLDELYFVSKKLRKIHFEDLNLAEIKKTCLKKFIQNYKFLPFLKLLKKFKLC